MSDMGLRERWRELLADECASMNAGCHASEAMNAAVERAVERMESQSEANKNCNRNVDALYEQKRALEESLRRIFTAWEGSVNADDPTLRVMRGEIEAARNAFSKEAKP